MERQEQARKRRKGETEDLGQSFYARVYNLCRSTLLVSESTSMISEYDASLESGSGFKTQSGDQESFIDNLKYFSEKVFIIFNRSEKAST